MKLSKILVAHDLSDTASRALAFADAIACRAKATVELAHVHPDVFDGHSEPALGTPWSAEQEQRYLRFLDAELVRIAREVLGSRAELMRHHVVRGEPVKRILDLAAELGVDAICVGSTGKGAVQRALLGSVSQQLLRSSRLPVLLVP